MNTFTLEPKGHFLLIVNYFVYDQGKPKIKTEIKVYDTQELAENRIKEIKDLGIEITPSHYGIYIQDKFGKHTKLKNAA